MKNLVRFFLIVIYPHLYGQAILGESINTTGIHGHSTHSAGVHGSCTNSNGVYASSSNSAGVSGTSSSGIGASFQGGGGIALELRGADSPWGDGTDDCVIHTDLADAGGDMILVALDNLHIHLDDDANSTSEFAIHNGTNGRIWSVSESGSVNALGAINGSSDLNRKENITSIESGNILKKVADLTISQWQFKGEKIRHLGPMA
jgi:hypothetical protein